MELGEILRSIVLFGNHVETETDAIAPARSKPPSRIQLLIVVSEITAANLQRLSVAFKNTPGSRQIAPMVLTPAELNSSTDVFPITFLDMKYRHKVLFGTDVLSKLEIQSKHLRLRCEQELKNLLFRTQSTYLTEFGKTRRLRELFFRSYESFQRTMRAITWLINKGAASNENEAIHLAYEELGLNAQRIDQLSNAYSGGIQIHLDSLHSLIPALIESVTEAATAIDQFADSFELIELN